MTLFSVAPTRAGEGRSEQGVAGVCVCTGVLGVVREDLTVPAAVFSCTLQVPTDASSSAADVNRSFLSIVRARKSW